MSTPSMSRGEAARWACILEVCAPKAGNVHPGADFADVTWRDFVRSAEAISPILNDAPARGVGQTVLDCVKATNAAVGRNTNLGIILLLAPMCAVKAGTPTRETMQDVLRALTVRDAEMVYEAIRIASPGGLGGTESQDVSQRPTQTLRDVMFLAKERDSIARQYVWDYEDVLGLANVYPALATMYGENEAIAWLHMCWLSRYSDSLIARKCGPEIADETLERACAVIAAGWPQSPSGVAAFQTFDAWLRADGNRRNPGTSADLIAAALYVCLREGTIRPPFPWVDRILESL